MKAKYVWSGLVLFAIAAIVYALNNDNFHIPYFNEGINATLSLVTEPDDGIAPVLAMISGASTSVELVMYGLQDTQVEAALAADERRGVSVRVILSAGYKGASSTVNTAAYDFLRSHGVSVRWSPGYFSLTHEKSLVVDNHTALIMTFNLTA